MPVKIQEILKLYEDLVSRVDAFYSQKVLNTVISSFELSALQKGAGTTFKSKIIHHLRFFLYDVEVVMSPHIKEADVLIWPVQLIHLDFLLPVYNALVKLGCNASFINLRDDIEEILANNNASAVKIQLKTKYKITYTNIRRGIRLLRIIKKAKSYNKANPYFSRYVEQALYNFFYWEIYSKAFELSKNFNPKYHLLGYEFSVVCRSVNQIANQLSIQTGNIQHGAINYNLSGFSICKQQFIWDKLTYEYLRKSGLNNELYITGSPGSKHFASSNECTNEIISENIKTNFKQIFLVCFSGPGHNVTAGGHILNLKHLQLIIEKSDDAYFIIKLHPKDNTDYYNTIRSLKNVMIVDREHINYVNPIGEFINISDCIITGASTVSIEALLNGKTVIAIDLKNELLHLEFLRNNMIYYCNSPDKVRNAFTSIHEMDNLFEEKMNEIKLYSSDYKLLVNSSPELRIASIIHDKIKTCVALQE